MPIGRKPPEKPDKPECELSLGVTLGMFLRQVLETQERIVKLQEEMFKEIKRMARITEEIAAYSAKIDAATDKIAAAVTAIQTRIDELIAGGTLPQEAKDILQADSDRLDQLASTLEAMGKNPGEVPLAPPVE